MTTELQTERHEDTLVLRLNGPATRNALSPQAYAAGVETLNMAEANPDVRAVVLTGAGGHFCGGGDLARLAHQRVHDMASQARDLDAFHQWIEALHSFPKPVIAAVEGVAAGGGVSLALACDLIVAADNARFVTAYSQVGLSSDGGASWHLRRALGRHRALALLWLGDSQSAHDWHQAGLVHAVTPNGQALRAAIELAGRLATRPQAVLASLKELVNEADQPLRDHLAAEKDRFIENLGQPEAGQAIEAFLQRRTRSAGD
jgi:enoyl-CoA hydratase/carnithine racemase